MKKFFLIFLVMLVGISYSYANDSYTPTESAVKYQSGAKEKNVEYDTIVSNKENWWKELEPRLKEGWEITSVVYEKKDNTVTIIVERPIKKGKNNSKTNDDRRLSKFYVPGQPLPEEECDATIVDSWYESRDYRYHIVNNEVVEIVKK